MKTCDEPHIGRTPRFSPQDPEAVTLTLSRTPGEEPGTLYGSSGLLALPGWGAASFKHAFTVAVHLETEPQL